jgi:hypothetical protein
MGDIIPYSANPPQKSPALPAGLGCGLNPVVLIQPGRCAPAGLGITRRSSNNELGGDGPGLVHRYDALLGKTRLAVQRRHLPDLGLPNTGLIACREMVDRDRATVARFLSRSLATAIPASPTVAPITGSVIIIGAEDTVSRLVAERIARTQTVS